MKGLLLPIPINKVLLIPYAKAYSIHIVRQATINEYSKDSIKYYPCHDLSYNSREMEKLSINDYFKDEDLNAI